MTRAGHGATPPHISRRGLLGGLTALGVGAGLTACGARGSDAASSSSASPTFPADQSATSKTVAWSNWPQYIASDNGVFPLNEEFRTRTGITIDYTEDINDNTTFYAKVRPLLEQGQSIDRDLVILTDWMADMWIRQGYARPLDAALIPTAKAGMVEQFASVPFDRDRAYTIPWQSGFSGMVANKPMLKELTGTDELRSLDQLLDTKVKGKVTVLSEMRDTMAVILAHLGYDASDFTDDQFNAGIDWLTSAIDSGQIRQVSGVDYTTSLSSGDSVIGIGWSGVHVLGPDFAFAIPEAGGGLWSDNFLIPASAENFANAHKLIEFYYDPAIAAKQSQYVQYITPVAGAGEAMESLDPTLVSNTGIFPTEDSLSKASVFMPLTPEQTTAYETQFQQAIGN
jgi:spermidine/putrescine transport system substrate-binding protein